MCSLLSVNAKFPKLVRSMIGGFYNGYQRPYGDNNHGQNNPNRPYPTQVPAGYYVAGAGYQQPAGGYNNNKYQSPGYGYNQGNTGYANNPYGNTGYGYGQQNRYGTKSGASSSTFGDSLKEALKKIGSDFIQKAVSGALKKN